MPTSEWTCDEVRPLPRTRRADRRMIAASDRFPYIEPKLQREASMLDVTRADAVLSREQKEKWDRDGYLILPQFFGADIVDPINALIERLSHRTARSEDIAGRVVVDLLAGTAHRR